jgi:NADP-dependent 3-hydroxy acid dehydrogenase YdfG
MHRTQSERHQATRRDRVVAITSASIGIGEATALMLGQSGATVVIGARRSNRLRDPKPFVWHADTDLILGKGRETF